MLLKVGELAKRTGLTIRTLHHYDDIGLLRPSARSQAGYRLYSRKDIERLHRIQALRGLGMSLAETGAVLMGPEPELAPLIDRQIQAIDQLLIAKTQLRNRLSRLKEQLVNGEELELDEWLKTLELMSMYEKYFSNEELEKMTFLQTGSSAQQQWSALVQEVKKLYETKTPPNSEIARTLAAEWMKTLELNTAYNPEWLAKLSSMHSAEPLFQEKLGVTQPLVAYVMEAFSESKLHIFKAYLSEGEYAYMRQNYAREMVKWPDLLIELEQVVDANVLPGSEQAKHLALKWLSMFKGYAGEDPVSHEKIRKAMQNEPALAEGTWLKQRTLHFLEQAVNSLKG